MPNNKYIRSTKRERERVKYWRSKGYVCARSAGSHSPYDVWAFHPELKQAVFEQIKTKKGARKIVIKDVRQFFGCAALYQLLSYE